MECPKCGGECFRDEVDAVVGTVFGPYKCPSCGWSEDTRYDSSDGKSPQVGMKPVPLPKCEHGRPDFENCSECRARDAEIIELLKPLEGQFWKDPSRHALKHFLFRTFRMGLRHHHPPADTLLEDE